MSAPMLEDKEDNTFHEDQAGIASRTVTDFPCCFVFLAYMVPRRRREGRPPSLVVGTGLVLYLFRYIRHDIYT